MSACMHPADTGETETSTINAAANRKMKITFRIPFSSLLLAVYVALNLFSLWHSLRQHYPILMKLPTFSPPPPFPSSEPPRLERRAVPVVKIAHQVQLSVVEHVFVHLHRFHLADQFIDHRLRRGPIPHIVRGILCPPSDVPKNLGWALPAIRKFNDLADDAKFGWNRKRTSV